MNSTEFINNLQATAAMKTLYIKGGFGLTLNEKGKKRAIKQYEYNEKRADMINAASDDTFGFDCCGLIKGIIWGFSGDPKKVYGGAKYESNDLKDLDEKGLINLCVISDDMKNIEPGELLYMPGHCGIYIGGDTVIESSPKWKNGVQRTEIFDRKWKCHGKLPQIVYQKSEQSVKNEKQDIPTYYLKLGSRGREVDKLQKCLNASINAGLKIDGMFGPLTRNALLQFQLKYNLMADGVYGPQTQKQLKEVIG